MGKVLIVNGGSLSDRFLQEMYQEFAPDQVIAVDGALAAFYRTGLPLTHIVGDFDTVSEEILQAYRTGSFFIEQHIPEKDETDSELAMELAIGLAPEEICILGATGYRMDHALANLQLLYRPFKEGIPCRIIDECNEIRLAQDCAVFKPDIRWKYISFLPFTDCVTGLTLKGFKYPLDGHRMEKGKMPGLGVSNEIVSDRAEMTAESGIVLCIRSQDR